MNKLHAGIAVVLAGLVALTLGAQGEAPENDNPAVVVGTFDSRGILMAYVRSDQFGRYLSAQKADIARAVERAEASGDDQLLAALNALGPAMQKRIHEQGFGSAPVDDIIARIEERLPAIAEEAGVDVIVSKWTLTYTGPGARFVDVTELLANEFDPSEATLKGIRDLARREPVPLDELDHDH